MSARHRANAAGKSETATALWAVFARGRQPHSAGQPNRPQRESDPPRTRDPEGNSQMSARDREATAALGTMLARARHHHHFAGQPNRARRESDPPRTRGRGNGSRKIARDCETATAMRTLLALAQLPLGWTAQPTAPRRRPSPRTRSGGQLAKDMSHREAATAMSTVLADGSYHRASNPFKQPYPLNR